MQKKMCARHLLRRLSLEALLFPPNPHLQRAALLYPPWSPCRSQRAAPRLLGSLPCEILIPKLVMSLFTKTCLVCYSGSWAFDVVQSSSQAFVWNPARLSQAHPVQ